MLDTLLESRALTERTAMGSAFSFVAHGVIISAAVLATRQAVTVAPDRTSETLVYIMPRDKPPVPVVEPPRPIEAQRIPRGFQIPVAPVEIPDVLPRIDLTQPVTDPRDYTGRGAPGGRADGDSTIRTPIRDLNATLYEFQVEKPAALISGLGTPMYPDVLKNAGIEGKVLVSFVVDPDGRADMSTLKVMKSDHPLFTEAVRSAMPRMRFLPAEVGGKKVKQFVQMPFVFSLK